MNDLVILVPDKNMESGLNSLLCRHRDFGIRQISYEIIRHPERDPGVYHRSVDLLRPFINQYHYAIAFIDYEGSGKEENTSDEIGEYIKSRLYGNGWKDRSEVIVIVPELEIWLWANSQYTAETIGWHNYPELKNWLVSKGFWQEDSPKPSSPKEALEKAIREKHIPRSSSIYSEIAGKINFHRCQDPSFKKFKKTLQKWFPIP